MRIIVGLIFFVLFCVSCASRESFIGQEQHRASFIFTKCYDVFSVKYPARKTEVLEFFIDDQGSIDKNFNFKGSVLKRKLGRCFYKNASRYRYTPSNREGRVSFRFKFGPARK